MVRYSYVCNLRCLGRWLLEMYALRLAAANANRLNSLPSAACLPSLA